MQKTPSLTLALALLSLFTVALVACPDDDTGTAGSMTTDTADVAEADGQPGDDVSSNFDLDQADLDQVDLDQADLDSPDATAADLTSDVSNDAISDDATADILEDTNGTSADLGDDQDPTPPAVNCDLPLLDDLLGAITYVCNCLAGADADCVAGDDGNDGSLPGAPLRTYEAARMTFGQMAAGDTVAFCRGGAFAVTAGNRWVNPNCQADQRCVVRDYEPGWASDDAGLPMITSESSGFALEDGGNANHEEGYVIANLHLQGDAADGSGLFFYNDIDDVTMCNLTIDGFRLGVHVGGSNAVEEGSDGRNARIILTESRITNNSAQGWLGACDGCGVTNSQFDNNGFAEAVFNHNIYFSGSDDNISQGMFAIGNDLYRSAIVEGSCQGVSLVVHGEHDGLLIEDNIVREDVGAAGGGCWGIAVDTGYGSDESFANITIRRNTLIDVGNVAIGVNACDHCLIENNLIIQTQARGATGIAAPNRDRGDGDLEMDAVTIRNNTIFFGPAASGRGISLGGEGGDHVSVSNAIYFAGEGNIDCFDYDLTGDAYAAIDHNLCYAPNATLEWVSGGGDLSAWQAAAPFDDASASDVDPSFVSTTPDYLLSPSNGESPLVDGGHPSLSAAVDRDGDERDESPDIGAFEL